MPTYDTQAVVNAAWGESLTYYSATGPTTFALSSVTGTRHLKGTTEGATSYGVYTILRELYTVSSDDVTAPKLRDKVAPVGSDALRVVTNVSGSPFLKFWTLEAQYPSLADALDESADVLRATNTPTDEGFRSPTFADAYTAVACRLQPDARTREWDTVGKVTTRAKYVAIFGSAVVLNAGDVVEVSSVKYEVVEQSEVESLGVLTFAACERIT